MAAPLQPMPDPGLHQALYSEIYQAAPEERFRAHSHQQVHLSLVLAGSFREITGSRDRECGPGTLRISRGGASHDMQFSASGARCLLLEPRGRAVARVVPLAGILDASYFTRSPELVAKVVQIHEEPASGDGSGDLAAEALLLEVLARAMIEMRHGPEEPVWLSDMVKDLRACDAGKASVEGLARRAGVHRVHLSRMFPRYYGRTIREHLGMLRLRHAASLLALSDVSVTEAALESGFSDQSHLTRTLGAWFGVTPSRYRHLGGYIRSRP